VSVLKSKSSIVLILGTIIILLLIPIWYVMLAPSIIASEIEKMDTTTSYEGTLGKEEYTQFLDDIVASEIEKTDITTSYEGTLYYLGYGVSYENVWPILIEAHVYADEVKGDNVSLKVEANTVNMTNPNAPNRLDEFSYNLTYVINKFTLENVPDAPDADKNRTGYDPLYPQHLKVDEDIPNVWLDNLNVTATLEYKESIEEEGLELYRYFVNETITKEMEIPPYGLRNVTLTSAKTLLIEPLSGVLAYTENETLIVWMGYKQMKYHIKLIDLTYKSTAEAKAEGIELAKKNHDDLELLELMHSVSPIRVEADAKAIGVKGDNVIVKVDAQVTRIDTGEILTDFAQDSTYVFNKFTRKNDPNATDADKPRSGYDPLYPSHLRKDENITTWFDTLNTTATLKFVESVVEDGVTLYKYSGTKKSTDMKFMGFTDCTLSFTRTVLVEPISGLPAYTEEETFTFNTTRAGYPPLPIVDLTYWSTAEAKAEGIELAKTSYDGIQLLEFYLPMIFGVVAIILVIGLALNIRRLERKKTETKTKSSASRR
jgi:hypothetical protein